MSNDSERYNGWTNRETWAVALHINNDQAWQGWALDAIRDRLREEGEAYSFGEVNDTLRARWAGEAVKDNVDEVLDMLWSATLDGSDMDTAHTYRLVTSDIGSLWRVNWDEIGAAFLDDVTEDED